ncbi:hypothetical protein H4R21_001825 [Coemansia helicoidea]|uniref:Uncharacterized protein n=1 Tax=Coemansia helicoidea TaxID=1286919 RepID=A0ACC1L986_9FUNG|nr:hypothetical protein H4R21_001825 [Coemansia helicoidea]
MLDASCMGLPAGELRQRGAVRKGANLPDDILFVIFKHAGRRARYTPDRWKKSLPLLAVCRDWRRAARPLVYRHLCVVCGDSSTLRQRPDPDGPASEPTDTPLATNLTLAAELGLLGLVRHMELTLNYVQDPFPCLGRVAAMLGASGRRWPAVRKLRVQLECSPYVRHQDPGDIARYAAEVADAAGMLSRLMPGLTVLESRGIDNNHVASALFGSLGGIYAGQATQIVSSNPLAVDDVHTFSRLTRLDIDMCGSTAYLLPKVSPLPLVSLRLCRVPHSYDWANFAAEDPARAVVFANLRALRLSYQHSPQRNEPVSPDANRRAIHGRLEFPRLTSLNITNYLGRSPILDCSVFPRRLVEVLLSCSVEEADALGSARVPAAGSFMMTLDYHPREAYIDAFAAVNRIATRAGGRIETHLLIMADLSYYSPSSTSSPYVTKLTVLTPLNVRALLAMLERLPNLASLSATRVMCGQIPNVATDIDSASAPPLSRSIQELTLRSYVAELDISRLTTLVMYLLPRLPELRVLHTTHVMDASIKQFVSTFAKHYPHLATVGLDLKHRH